MIDFHPSPKKIISRFKSFWAQLPNKEQKWVLGDLSTKLPLAMFCKKGNEFGDVTYRYNTCT
jgi:hypothetical protein